MNDWAVIIVVYLTVFISSPLIAILHELGHALAYLLFTKPQRIDIYIGSYTKAPNAIQFNTGKLHFYIKRSFPFVKGIGLCRSYKAETNYVKAIVIYLAGTVFTLFSAGVIVLIAVNNDASLLLKISCYIMLGLSALSLIANLLPWETDKWGRHEDINSDGMQILFALQVRDAWPDYIEALEYYHEREYFQASQKFKAVLAIAPYNQKITQLFIYTSLQSKQYDDAASCLSTVERNRELSTYELFYKGCLQSTANKHDEAIKTYSKLLKQNKNHILALNNIASELIEKGAHEVAEQALNRAIKNNANVSIVYATYSYSKILQGDLEAGKTMVSKSLELDPENADAFKVLGIYYLKLENAALATENFNKALELNPDIDLGIYADQFATSNHSAQL